MIPIFGLGIVGPIGHFERRSAAVDPLRPFAHCKRTFADFAVRQEAVT